MRTYRAPNVYDSRSHRAEAGLSAQYLEAMDDDRGFGADSDEEEDAEDTGLGYSGPADLRRSNFGVSTSPSAPRSFCSCISRQQTGQSRGQITLLEGSPLQQRQQHEGAEFVHSRMILLAEEGKPE